MYDNIAQYFPAGSFYKHLIDNSAVPNWSEGWRFHKLDLS